MKRKFRDEQAMLDEIERLGGIVAGQAQTIMHGARERGHMKDSLEAHLQGERVMAPSRRPCTCMFCEDLMKLAERFNDGRDALIAQLWKRQGHRLWCPFARQGSGECTCGWAAVEQRVRAILEGAASGQASSETQSGAAAPAPFEGADDLMHTAATVITNAMDRLAAPGPSRYSNLEWIADAEKWRARYQEWLEAPDQEWLEAPDLTTVQEQYEAELSRKDGQIERLQDIIRRGRAVLEEVDGSGAPVTTWLPDQSGWALRLNRYQRDNLLLLLNAIGYPAGPSWPNPHIDPALAHRNTGDWVGEVALMLARTDGSIVIDARDLPNLVDKPKGEGQ